MCVRVWFELAAVQLHPRRVRRKARIFSSVTHLGRWAWLGGREWGGREGEISVGPLLCTRGVKQRSQRGEERRLCSRGSGSSGSSGAFENTAGNEGEVGRLVSD